MIKLFTDQEFNTSKGSDLLKIQCYHCQICFYKSKKNVINALNPKRPQDVLKYCSKTCANNAKRKKIDHPCTNCGKFIKRTPLVINRTSNHFCSSSCSAKYGNSHKTHGYRRSKLEIYIESTLTKLYPNLQIEFNKINAINAELDIYIPSLKLAFELNGIFHYEPIYGIDRLSQQQNNDVRKYQTCLEHNIELCIIDSSQQKYFKEATSQKYLDIIINLIEVKLNQ